MQKNFFIDHAIIIEIYKAGQTKKTTVRFNIWSKNVFWKQNR